MENKILINIINTKLIEMNKSLKYLKKYFLHIKIGKANIFIFNNIYIEYHNSLVPLNKIANIIAIDYKTIKIQPWEKFMLKSIEKAIINSNLGFTPTNNGKILLINIPPLTEEGRKEIVKKAKSETENTKISIRNIRKEAYNFLKKNNKIDKDILKNIENNIEITTNIYIKQIDKLFNDKKKEIMTI